MVKMSDNTSEKTGPLLIYIDNSNIWISTQKKSARELKFLNGIEEDPRVRVGFKNLVDEAAQGRPILRCVLYGSKPPNPETFWENLKKCNVEVQVTEKSGYTHKEREVDQNINLHIGIDIGRLEEHTTTGGTVILFTGDGGMISAVREALKNNWKVELWSYELSIASGYKQLAKENEGFKICYMDNYFKKPEFVYYSLLWKNNLHFKKIPAERSFVITWKHGSKSDKELLEFLVNKFTSHLRLPMSGCILNVRDQFKEEIHIALVCNVKPKILKEDARCHSPLNPPNLTIGQDRWDKMKDVLRPLGLKFKDDEADTICKEKLENILKKVVASSIADEKYDFNKDVCEKAERLGKEKLKKKGFKQLRSFPQFRQDSNYDNAPTIEAPGHEDDESQVYEIPMQYRQEQRLKKPPKSPCKYGFGCNEAVVDSGRVLGCNFRHSPEEIQYFANYTDLNVRGTYKFKECNDFKAGFCRRGQPKSYMCPFAHGVYCKGCKRDDAGGHDLKRCQSRTVSSA